MAPETQELTEEERLIASIARSICFCFSVDAANTPKSDVASYVMLLLELFREKPNAVVSAGDASTVRESVSFCAEQLDECAPDQAAALRAALGAH